MSSLLSLAVFLAVLVNQTSGFTAPVTRKYPTCHTFRSAVKIAGYDDAFRTIDQCAASGTPTEELYDSVRFIDKNSLKIYPNEQEKQALWDEAHGSWRLQLATGGGKYTTFKKVPIFAFAMIDDKNFGNGVGWNQDSIILSLLGPHFFNTQRRQMVITIDDMYLRRIQGNKVCAFLCEGWHGLGKTSMGLPKALSAARLYHDWSE